MSGRRFRVIFWSVAAWFAILTAAILSLDPASDAFVKLRAALPLLIGLPAAGLAESFRRRQTFKANVLEVYSRASADFQRAMQYTLRKNPNIDQFLESQTAISGSIDQIRTLFANIPASGTRAGLYPFEAIKTILDWVEWLDYGDDWKGEAAAKEAREAVALLWKDHIRSPLLQELAPKPPSKRMSPYITNDKRVASEISQDGWPLPDKPREVHRWPAHRKII